MKKKNHWKCRSRKQGCWLFISFNIKLLELRLQVSKGFQNEQTKVWSQED